MNALQIQNGGNKYAKKTVTAGTMVSARTGLAHVGAATV